jgi:hypothetical protein
MPNLTLSIDDKLLQAARIRAVREGTSVNEVCRLALEAYAHPAAQSRLARYLQLQAEIDATPREEEPLPPQHRGREELYEQILQEREPAPTPAPAGGMRKKSVRVQG